MKTGLGFFAGSSGPPPPIGPPTKLFSAAFVNVVSGLPSTGTSVDAPAGSLIVVALLNQVQNQGVSSLVDSAGNTYTQAESSALSLSYYSTSIWYCSNTLNDLPSGGTFTPTTTGGATVFIQAVAVSGANGGLDQTATENVTGTGFSLSTGALASASEIAFGAWNPSNLFGTYTEGAGFTTIIADNGFIVFSYDIVSTNTAITWAPSWTSSVAASPVLATFKAG